MVACPCSVQGGGLQAWVFIVAIEVGHQNGCGQGNLNGRACTIT